MNDYARTFTLLGSLVLTIAPLAYGESEPQINPRLLKYTWPAQWVAHAAGPYRDFGVFNFVEKGPAVIKA